MLHYDEVLKIDHRSLRRLVAIELKIGRLLSEIWRVKGLAEQEYGPQHPITKKLAGMHGEAQALLQEKTGKL